MFYVGNDVVDFTNRRTAAKVADSRFVERVLAPEELAFFYRAENRMAALWSFWSAKETAYKVCRKLDSHAAFSPRLYRVNFLPNDVFSVRESFAGGNRCGGTAVSKYGNISFHTTITDEYVHCIGSNRESMLPAIRKEIRKMGGASKKDESTLVRQMAVQALADFLACSRDEVEIKRFKSSDGLGPPAVYVAGRRAEIDISLSHDGPFCAYAFLSP